MKRRLLLTLVGMAIGFALPTFAQQISAPDPQLREQLLAFVTKYEAAINNSDAAAAAAFFAEDGVLVNDTGPIYGQKAIEKYYAGVFQNVHFSNYIITVDPNFPQIIGKASDEAWSTGEWSSTVRGENLGPVEKKGYWSVIDTREGDARKIRMLTWNMTSAPPPPAQTNTPPSSAQEQNKVDPEVRQQIEAVFQKYQETYNKHDAAAMAALFTEDAVEVRNWPGDEHGGTASGREAIEKRFAADFAFSPGKMVNEIVLEYAVGNDICAIVNTSVGGTLVGTWRDQEVRFYVRDGDTWKIRMAYVNLSSSHRELKPLTPVQE